MQELQEKIQNLSINNDVIVEKTNFYAEMGGQVADTGVVSNENFSANVTNVINAPNKQHLHHIKVSYGSLKVGDKLKLVLDKQRRFAIMRNHSATHLLQAALIKFIGNDVRQKGSFVNENYLRFDFSQFEKIDHSSLNRIERPVNEYISQAIEGKVLLFVLNICKLLKK